MRPYISEERCNLCNECVEVCPYDVFAAAGERVDVLYPELCIECLACMKTCPNKAITMDD